MGAAEQRGPNARRIPADLAALCAELLTPAEVAHILRVDPKTVVRWDKSGKLRSALRTAGGHRRYRAADVRALIDRGRQR